MSKSSDFHALRAGRGRGYLQAVQGGSLSVGDVLACVVDDPRWDRQVESRATYYAEILVQMGANLTNVLRELGAAQMEVPGSGTSLAFRVVGELGRLGADGAADWLAAFPLPTQEGRENREVPEERARPARSERLVINRKTPSELLLQEVGAGRRRMARVEELARRGDAETYRLLAQTVRVGTLEQKHLALEVLGRRGAPEYLADAESALREQAQALTPQAGDAHSRRMWLDYLNALPGTETIAFARRWVSEAWPLSLAADHILARAATEDDERLILQIGRASLASGEMYRLCSMVDAAACLQSSDETLSFLCEAYEEAPYSFARIRVMAAWSGMKTNERVDALRWEALWDCESASRQLAREAGFSREQPVRE